MDFKVLQHHLLPGSRLYFCSFTRLSKMMLGLFVFSDHTKDHFMSLLKLLISWLQILENGQGIIYNFPASSHIRACRFLLSSLLSYLIFLFYFILFFTVNDPGLFSRWYHYASMGLTVIGFCMIVKKGIEYVLERRQRWEFQRRYVKFVEKREHGNICYITEVTACLLAPTFIEWLGLIVSSQMNQPLFKFSVNSVTPSLSITLSFVIISLLMKVQRLQGWW